MGRAKAGSKESLHVKALKKRENEEGEPSLNCPTVTPAWRMRPKEQNIAPWINSASSFHLNIFKSSSQNYFAKGTKCPWFKTKQNTIFFTYNLSDMSVSHRWKGTRALVRMLSATEPRKSLNPQTGSTEIRQAQWLAASSTAPELMSSLLYRPGEGFVLKLAPHMLIRWLPGVIGAPCSCSIPKTD